MIITSIELKNWTSHLHTRLAFDKGINVIVGPLGSGKSSLLDAIYFALFGKVRRGEKSEDVIRRGKDYAMVILEFEHRGEKFRVVRTIKKGSTEAILFLNGKFYAKGSSKVSEAIEYKLSIDRKSFERAVYAAQNRLDLFIDMKPSERKKALDEMLGIEKLQQYVETIKSSINWLKKELKAGVDVEEGERYIKKLNEIREKLDELTSKEKGLLEEKKNLSTVFEREKQLLDKMENELREKKRLSEEITSLAARLSVLSSFDYEPLKKEYEELVKEKRALESNLSEVKNALDRLRKRILDNEKKRALYEEMIKSRKEIEKRIADIRLKLSEEIPSLENLVEKISKVRVLLGKVEAQLTDVKEKLSNITSLGDVCPICLRPLSEEHKEKMIRELKESYESLEVKRKKLLALLDKYEKDRKNVEEKVRERYYLQKEMNRLMKELSKELPVFEDVVPLKQEERELYKREKELLSQLAKIRERENVVKEKIDMALERVNVEEKLKLLREKAKDINVNEEDVLKKREEIYALSSKIKEIDKELEFVKKEKDYLVREKKDVEERYETWRKMYERYKRVEIALEELKTAQAILESSQLALRKEVVDKLNAALSFLWSVFYPYDDYGNLKILVEKDGYELYFKTQNGWEKVKSVASGGEKALASLSLRVALSFVVAPHIGLLILDEPTHNLDDNAVEMLKEALERDMPKVVKQFFVVTHDVRLSDIVGRVFVMKRKKVGFDPVVVEG